MLPSSFKMSTNPFSYVKFQVALSDDIVARNKQD
jgi:hypothetical protein